MTTAIAGPLLRFQALCLDTGAAHLETVASLWIDVVPEPVTVKDRTHLDVRVDDVETLVAAGATVVDRASFPWVVMRDPEGGELCAFPVRDGADPGLDEGDAWAYVAGLPGAPFEAWVFCPVPEPKSAKDRVHLDFRATRSDSVDLLAGRGATVLRTPDDLVSWHVLDDPEGNELCVFPPERA